MGKTNSVLYTELAPQEFLERLNACPVAYLPLGTLEWHGPQLPLGTDLLEGQALFALAAQRLSGSAASCCPVSLSARTATRRKTAWTSTLM